MRTHVLTRALIAATMSMIGPAICPAAQAAPDITIAAIAAGRLYVVGTTERPHTTVSLDNRFTTESDDAGKFQYELVYHPARCIVAAEIEGKTHEAVVSNCGQKQPAVSTKAAACAPVTVAAVPLEPGGSKNSDPLAAPAQTGTLPAPSAGLIEPKPRHPAPRTVDRAKRAPAMAQAPAKREVLRPARYQRHKPTVRSTVEEQEPDEAIPED